MLGSLTLTLTFVFQTTTIQYIFIYLSPKRMSLLKRLRALARRPQSWP